MTYEEMFITLSLMIIGLCLAGGISVLIIHVNVRNNHIHKKSSPFRGFMDFDDSPLSFGRVLLASLYKKI